MSPVPGKRRILSDNPKSVFSRLSGPPNRDTEKPRIQSRVIRELPSRQEIVAAQGGDAESRARNRRMFGSLLGTLQKFCQEESRLKPKEEKKAQIEKKLEEQEIQERENLKKEKQNLYSNRKRQQLEIKILEYKMTRMAELEDWEKSMKPLENYIRTKSKPFIYYRPKNIDKKTQQKIDDNKTAMTKIIEKKRLDVAEELKKMEKRFRNSDNENFDGETDDDKAYASMDDDYQQNFEQETNLVDNEKRSVQKSECNNRLMSGIIVKIERETVNTIQSVVATPVQYTEKNANPTLRSEIIKSSSSSKNGDTLI